jgi:uncharacterized membrane protein
MSSLPLHPAIVHLPLGLAVLMPILAGGFAWALWRGRVRPRAWIAVVALQALLVGGGFVAMKTGEAEEDRVEAVVTKNAIHEHEELAEQFVWSAGLTLALTALVLVMRRPAAVRMASAVAVLGTVVVTGMALRVGHAGGELVYAHGAASAYTSQARAGTPEPGTPAAAARQADEDDDGGRVR